MLLWFVIIYWIISVAIGIYAAKWVHNTKDFAVAGRRMPMYIVTATVFATWFGSETVLGIPATFLSRCYRRNKRQRCQRRNNEFFHVCFPEGSPISRLRPNCGCSKEGPSIQTEAKPEPHETHDYFLWLTDVLRILRAPFGQTAASCAT